MGTSRSEFYGKTQENIVVDKLSLIKMILETDEETDKKILSVIKNIPIVSDESPKVRIEERTTSRKDVILDVDLNTGTEKIWAETDNISTSGAFIRTNKKIARGEDIAIKLIVPDGDEFGFLAEVVRVNETGIGVMIKSISNKSSEKLLKYLSQLI